MLLFGNTGFIGIPVINALYGKEAVFYASIIEMVNDIMIFTVGISLIQRSAGRKTKLNVKEFLSPGIIGICIGFTLFLTDNSLPLLINKSIEIIGAATTPLSMFVIGSQIAEIKFKELVGDKVIYITSFAKLLIIPLATMFVTRIIFNDFSLLATVATISFAMPIASCTTIFSQQYKGDVDFATKGVLLSTLLCLITIPIFAIFLR